MRTNSMVYDIHLEMAEERVGIKLVGLQKLNLNKEERCENFYL